MKISISPDSYWFLRTYLDFLYYLFVSPFRLLQPPEVEQTRWRRVLSTCHRCVSGAILLLLIPLLVGEVRILVPTDPNDAVQYLLFYLSLSDFCAKIILLEKLWRRMEQFLELLEFYDTEQIRSAESSQRPKILAYGICLLYLFVACLNIGMGGTLGGQVGSSSHKTVSSWLDDKKELAKFNFFLTESNVDGVLLQLLLSATILTYMTKCILNTFVDLFVLMSSLSLWHATRHFVDNMESLAEAGKLFESFNRLKKFSDRVNRLVSTNALILTTGLIVLYSTGFQEVTTAGFLQGAFKWIRLIFFVGGCTLTLLNAAGIQHMLGKVRTWILADPERMNEPANVIILQEIEAGTIGIRAGPFPISYGTLKSALGASVTFFLLCLEATNSKQSGAETSSITGVVTGLSPNSTETFQNVSL